MSKVHTIAHYLKFIISSEQATLVNLTKTNSNY